MKIPTLVNATTDHQWEEDELVAGAIEQWVIQPHAGGVPYSSPNSVLLL